MTLHRSFRPAALFAAGFAFLACVAPRESFAQARRPVVMISIDGFRPDYLLEADKHGLKIPNLRRLLADGAHATGMRGVTPTVTYPSHATLVTGVSPAVHRILANTTFDPFNKNQGGWYWYAEEIAVETLWDLAEDAGLVTASVHWPVTVGARIDWNIPQVWRTGEPDDRKLVRALSTRRLIDELEREVGKPYPDGADETIEGDERRGLFVAQLISDKKPDLMLAYFTALDHAQHESGPLSKPAFETLERIDAIIGSVRSAADRAHGKNAVIAIVADHGFEPIARQLNLHIALRNAGLLEFAVDDNTHPKAWRAAAWASGASAAIMIRDPADAAAKREVAAMLQRLQADTISGIARVLDETSARRYRGWSGAAFVVDMRPGFTIGGEWTGPVISASKSRGMHGYLPDGANMNASFVIAGPGVPRGKSLGEGDQRDVAPTLAKFLGLKLSKAEGKVLIP